MLEKIKSKGKVLMLPLMATLMSVSAGVTCFASDGEGGTGAVDMVTEQFSAISTDVLAIVGVVIGIALGIFATVFGVKFALKFFKSMTNKAG